MDTAMVEQMVTGLNGRGEQVLLGTLFSNSSN